MTNLTHMPGCIVEAEIRAQHVFFFVKNNADVIQNRHFNGCFYEPEELAIIARHFKPGQSFLDVGSNVGNHAIYVAKFLGAHTVMVIEPNPYAVSILRVNLRLNMLTNVDDRFLGLGFGDRDQTGVLEVPDNNLGGSKFRSQSDGGIRIVAGDTLLQGRKFDFIKIDVEGQEIEVLKGLQQTIAVAQPRIFIEVDNKNVDDFARWLSNNSYVLVERFRRYSSNENFLIMPGEKM
jgi:FkbM family methyltransferase